MRFRFLAMSALAVSALSGPALSAPCGQGSGGFETWKQAFAAEAAHEGVGKRGLAALAQTRYAQSTINADRGQKSFKLSYEKFCQLRGCDVIVSQGRKRKAQNPGFYTSLEQSYGVPAGVILAIHGMETGFGNFKGDSNVLNAAATLTYDCRRPDFFRPHLMGALKMIDAGMMSPAAVGAKHGELGHTQFLPGNAFAFGRDGNGDGKVDFDNQADALASTANYLRAKGWRPGQDYQPGSYNYNVLHEWNAASVYQQSLAVMGHQIDR